MMVFHSLRAALVAGFQVYDRTADSYLVRTRTAKGFAFALVIVREQAIAVEAGATAALSALAAAMASLSANAPSSRMRSLCSASGIKTMGGTDPRSGWCQRISASKPSAM